MREVTATDVHKIIDQKEEGVILNVLPRESFAKKHLPKSVNVPVSDPDFIEEVREVVPDKDMPIVVHCSGPTCDASPKAAARLEQEGYRDVREFRGGLEEWERAGYTFDAPSGAI
jgi:rhodanese-related sulfurtransferase